MRANTLRHLMNLWPPFLCNGIRVKHLASDWSGAHVVLRLRRWNSNYVGTQFGGNLFAMADPFWMLLVMHRLGPGYHVWDRAGEIDFQAPGREDVHARFELQQATIDALRAAAADGRKVLRWFEVNLTCADGTQVATVRKQLYIRLKPRHRPAVPEADLP